MTREELITLMDHFLVGSRRLPLAISQQGKLPATAHW